MGLFKSTNIEFEGKVQAIDDLISRARFYAQTNRTYSLEIIVHLQDHARQYDDSALFDVCRKLMMLVQSPSPYPTNNSKQKAADVNNLPNPQPRELTWEEKKRCFKDALIYVMDLKKDDGDYLFNKGPKWIVPYRFAVDKKDIMYDKDALRKRQDFSGAQYEQFENLATELKLHDNSLIRIPFERGYINQITKPNYARFNQPWPWPSDGIENARTYSLLVDMNEIYKELQLAYKTFVEALKKQV